MAGAASGDIATISSFGMNNNKEKQIAGNAAFINNRSHRHEGRSSAAQSLHLQLQG